VRGSFYAVRGKELRNFVKEKIKGGRASVGTWVEMNNPDVAEQLVDLGFDWLVLDAEHGTFTFPEVQRMMQGMGAKSDCIPLVRIPYNDPVYCKWALDIGSYGIVCPFVNTREDALRVVQSCKYPPEGIRGCGPRRASHYGANYADYVKKANEEVLVVVMIETQKALDNLDEILSVDGVDAAFIGPDDLSLNLGLFLQKQHPTFKAALAKVVEKCKKHRVAPGMHCNENNISEAISQGFQFCALNDDDTFLTFGARSCLEKVKGWTH
jgi:2-keto-3-deoxy-L-rhamnonate aldolase RhmA